MASLNDSLDGTSHASLDGTFDVTSDDTSDGTSDSASDDTLARIGRLGVVPVVVIDDARQARPMAEALAEAGLPGAELTLRTPAALEAITEVSRVEGFLAGAGTVLTGAQARRAIDAGAGFLVSPGLSRDVVETGRAAGLPVLPGVATATELITALELGIDTVKFFPAAFAGGPGALRALASPFPWVRFMPTGGIRPDALPDYLAIPAVLAVGGTWITTPELVRRGDYRSIGRLAREAASAVARLRQPRPPATPSTARNAS